MAQLYVYDGSFEGFLTSIFHAYPMNPEQVDFCQEEQYCCSFFQPVMVNTEIQLAERVSNGIRRTLTEDSLTTVYHAWLSHLEGIEPAIFRFLKRSFAEGRCLCGFRQDPEVFPVMKAAYAVGGEAHRILGLLRFTKIGRLYVADIRPTYDLLPIIGPHFLDRFHSQPFLIRDRHYMQALAYNGKQVSIGKFESFKELDQQPEEAEALWQAYYKAIAISERKNPKLRRQFMPKKYWEFLTEMQDQPEAHKNGFEKAIRTLPKIKLEQDQFFPPSTTFLEKA